MSAFETNYEYVCRKLDRANARLAEVTAERDRLAAAIQAIPRHHQLVGASSGYAYGVCDACDHWWPCSTEQAHIAAAVT